MRGRKKGGHNRGYWFRTGRGWYVTLPGGKSVPLCDPEGNPLRNRNASQELLKESYACWVLAHRNGEKMTGRDDLRILDVCRYFLHYLRQSARPKGFKIRAEMLFDFCSGYPGRLHDARQIPEGVRRIPEGFGQLLVSELTPIHVQEWLAAHAAWGATMRAMAINSLKRAINYAVKAKLIPANPIRQVRPPKTRARITYFSEEEEAALLENASPSFAETIRVCIRTGARPGEFCRLTANHVEETPRGQRWRFSPEEIKNRRERIVFVPDDIAEIVRRKMREVPKGTPLFRTPRGKPWTPDTLRMKFDILRRKLLGKGIELPKDSCFYSCRHTFAKRMLGGYWGGRPCTIEQLAGLMGNTPKVCWEHYAKWCEAYTDPLWDAVNPRGESRESPQSLGDTADLADPARAAASADGKTRPSARIRPATRDENAIDPSG